MCSESFVSPRVTQALLPRQCAYISWDTMIQHMLFDRVRSDLARSNPPSRHGKPVLSSINELKNQPATSLIGHKWHARNGKGKNLLLLSSFNGLEEEDEEQSRASRESAYALNLK